MSRQSEICEKLYVLKILSNYEIELCELGRYGEAFGGKMSFFLKHLAVYTLLKHTSTWRFLELKNQALGLS